MKGCWCFSNGKSCCERCCSRGRGESETSAGRSCFGSENDGGMAGWDVFVNGKKWKVLNRGVSASGKQSPVFFSGVSASEK